MRKMIFFVSIAALAVFAFSSFTLAQPEVTAVQDKIHSLKIELSGGAEVPGPGDSNGSGMAHLNLNHDKGEICYEITVKDIQTPTAVHIHAGALGKSGDVKVTFKKTADGMWKGCANADKALLNDLMQNPGNYYVNVHNAEFPNGAIRGQLGK